MRELKSPNRVIFLWSCKFLLLSAMRYLIAFCASTFRSFSSICDLRFVFSLSIECSSILPSLINYWRSFSACRAVLVVFTSDGRWSTMTVSGSIYSSIYFVFLSHFFTATFVNSSKTLLKSLTKLGWLYRNEARLSSIIYLFGATMVLENISIDSMLTSAVIPGNMDIISISGWLWWRFYSYFTSDAYVS